MGVSFLEGLRIPPSSPEVLLLGRGIVGKEGLRMPPSSPEVLLLGRGIVGTGLLEPGLVL